MTSWGGLRPMRFGILGNGVVDPTVKPFDTNRIHHQWRLAWASQLPGGSVASERMLADEIEADDILFREMQRAVLEDDVPRCEAAAKKLGSLTARGYETVLCSKLHVAYAAHKRLEAKLVEAMKEGLPPLP